ncbi:MAG: UDP-N-acetylglucosamine 2-epimerase (non-hydrolyzing) [Thermoanaerobaculia bacterium]|nr:UDP-N-acetylglucosamine 2-epimerase (non-hydrolyzing) [Thermoanaerobaculia bacterium]
MSGANPATGGRRKVLVVYGTRPEAIKLAPVVWALRARPERFAVAVCCSGQHRELLAGLAPALALAPDRELDLMRPGAGLNELFSRLLIGLDGEIAAAAPDWVVVQGDTSTTLAGALAAFHRGVPVAHVEAGLRTKDLARPFPEEANRQLVDRLSTLLFAPTEGACAALAAEGISGAGVEVTGNTGIDTLLRVVSSLPAGPPRADVLVTVHRRESFGAPLEGILAGVRDLATGFPGSRFLLPVHPNPEVAPRVVAALAGVPNVELVPPLEYPALVAALRDSRFVLTDSGGLQEEAPALGKPVLVLREVTERPEGVALGVARLVGSARGRIVAEGARLLSDEAAYRAMARVELPYGDGRAAERIADRLAVEGDG